jgi:hypothetical protein
MSGFPGTFIISEEVATAQSHSEEEREYLLSYIPNPDKSEPKKIMGHGFEWMKRI